MRRKTDDGSKAGLAMTNGSENETFAPIMREITDKTPMGVRLDRIRKRTTVLRSVRSTIVLVLLFALVALFSLNLLQAKLLENAHQMGNALANSYAIEEENNALVYQQVAGLESLYFKKYVEEGWSSEQLADWMHELGENMTSSTPANAFYPYALVNGEVISSDSSYDLSGGDYESTEWYREATSHPGEVVFTDVYADRITGDAVITIAIAVDDTPNILAFDIHPDSFGSQGTNPISLPDGSSYYLFDGSGTLLYHDSQFPDNEETQAYLDEMLAGVKTGSFEENDSSIVDPAGKQRAVYYHIADNGWISVVTVPFSTLLGDLNAFTIGFGVVFALLLALTVWQGVRDFRSSALVERTNDTVRVLGNSYYAIYRINYRQGTYEATKGSDHVRARLPETGPYQSLVDCVIDVIEPKTREVFARNFSLDSIRSLAERGVRDFGGDFLRLFGSRYLWVNVRLLLDESLSGEEAVLCFRIVDEEKRADLQRLQLLEDSLDVAHRSQKARNRFFSSMSHDLRTPLNAIINLSQLADSRADDPEATHAYLGKIRTAGSQMLTLVNDILDVSRLEEGDGLSVQSAEFDLVECVRECAGQFEEQARREGKRLSIDTNVQDRFVCGDAGRLTQVLNNLLSNAFKYSDAEAEIALDVRQVSSGDRHNSYQFTVSDTGIGMSEEFLDRIFVPYERETTFGARKVTGTGLGMPIVKSIVDRMDGTIKVESELGHGSTFTVTIPLENARFFSAGKAEAQAAGENQETHVDAADAQAEPKADESSVQASGAAPESASHGAMPSAAEPSSNVRIEMFSDAAAESAVAGGNAGDVLRGRRILVAEDNEINREITIEMLSMRGMDATCAEDGLAAVDAFAASDAGHFDAVLMDMQMPRMDGCEAARRIRSMARPDAKTVPIIATTANAFAEDIAATTEAGMNAHVSKPIDFQALFAVLEEQIRAYRER